MTLNGEMALLLRYFTEFDTETYCGKVADKAITMDNLLCLVASSKRLQMDRATPTA